MKVILGYSFGRGNPQPWKYFEVPAIMINIIDAKKHDFPIIDYNGELWVDSGGFQVLNNGLKLDPKRVAKWQAKYNPDFAIMPDNPKCRRISLEWYKEYLKSNPRPENCIPVIHPNWTIKEIDELLALIDSDYIAIGGLVPYFRVPLKRNKIRDVIEFVMYIKELFGCKIHVLGVGGYHMIPILKVLDVTSFDTSSWIIDAAYGLIRVGSKAYSVKLKNNGKNPDLPSGFVCNCPACKVFGNDIKKNGIRGLRARALHNAWNLLNFVREMNKKTTNELVSLIRFRTIKGILKGFLEKPRTISMFSPLPQFFRLK